MPSSPPTSSFLPHLLSSLIAAIINFPLWKASALAQSGALGSTKNSSYLTVYKNAIKPPYKGIPAVVLGMSWARFAIFYGSERFSYAFSGVISSSKKNEPSFVETLLPPMLLSTFVQIVNMPLIRTSIVLQSPDCHWKGTTDGLQSLYRSEGVKGLWKGTSAGIMKTVPKYVVAVGVKNKFNAFFKNLPPPASKKEEMLRSGGKSLCAGIAGATLTNPADVVRNEMFKKENNRGLRGTVKFLQERHGWRWVTRGIDKNLVAVAVPIGTTIFLADVISIYI